MTHETTPSLATAVMRLAVSGGDPTTRLRGDFLWRSTRTVDGPATVRIPLSGRTTGLMAWGPGAESMMASVPSLTGARDHPLKVQAVHSAVREACRRHWSVPFVRSDDPYHELLPAVLGQRVTAAEAARQWAGLCRAYGGTSPGPDADILLPPDPSRLAEIAYHELHRFGVERRRAETLISVARRSAGLLLGSATRSLSRTSEMTMIHGVGPWTAAIAGAAAFGDSDAVPVGDFHIKNTVAFALGGNPRGSDEEMLDLLAPYLGQRGRVLWWLALDGWRAPRRGPGRRNLSVANL